MSISQSQFTDLTGFEATQGEMQDAEAARDRLAEERKINPLFAKVVDLDQTGVTTGS
jgi:hypothetical protein